MKYFAYGSNMSEKRLQKRVPSAKRLGKYYLKSHQLRFHKASEDGSAKCDAYCTDNPEDIIIGALFEMNESDRAYLDKVEGLGLGYDEKYVSVISDTAEEVTALIYVATHINNNLKPYTWYLNHVVIGAKETGVPDEYLTSIETTSAIADPLYQRDLMERGIYLATQD